MNAKIYNNKGKETGKIELPESVFGVKWNADLVHQTVNSMLSARRTNVAHTKTRGEVRGGGKKPWKQKGTGRARHGSTRSPLWVGGGVTHGPRNDKNFDRKINSKSKAKALASVLSAKLADNEIIFVDSLGLKEPKTKEAIGILKNFSAIGGFEKIVSKRKNAAFIITPEKSRTVEKSFSNIGNIAVAEARNINPADILAVKYLLIENPESSLKTLEQRVGGK